MTVRCLLQIHTSNGCILPKSIAARCISLSDSGGPRYLLRGMTKDGRYKSVRVG